MELIRHLRLTAAIAVAVASIPAAALSRDRVKYYPICAFGRIIYAPFPGGEKNENPGHDGVCHATRFGDRAKLVPLKSKNR